MGQRQRLQRLRRVRGQHAEPSVSQAGREDPLSRRPATRRGLRIGVGAGLDKCASPLLATQGVDARRSVEPRRAECGIGRCSGAAVVRGMRVMSDCIAVAGAAPRADPSRRVVSAAGGHHRPHAHVAPARAEGFDGEDQGADKTAADSKKLRDARKDPRQQAQELTTRAGAGGWSRLYAAEFMWGRLSTSQTRDSTASTCLRRGRAGPRRVPSTPVALTTALD